MVCTKFTAWYTTSAMSSGSLLYSISKRASASLKPSKNLRTRSSYRVLYSLNLYAFAYKRFSSAAYSSAVSPGYWLCWLNLAAYVFVVSSTLNRLFGSLISSVYRLRVCLDNCVKTKSPALPCNLGIR